MPSPDRVRSCAIRARVALAAYLVFVAFTVWLPAAISGKVVGLVVFLARWVALHGIASYEASLVSFEFLANIVLLVPVGVLLSLAWPQLRWWHVSVIGLLMSGLVETVQSLIPSRAPSISDVLANTLGTLIGAGIVVVAARSGRRRAHGVPRRGEESGPR